jgi:hypothetical protein
MATAGVGTNWRQLREFRDVDLSGSYVVAWSIEAETLLLEIDLLLTPQHPFYEKPRPAEKVCIRPAVIEFRFCEMPETTAQLGVGRISDLVVLGSGRYAISGEFGVVEIDAERPILRLKAS